MLLDDRLRLERTVVDAEMLTERIFELLRSSVGLAQRTEDDPLAGTEERKGSGEADDDQGEAAFASRHDPLPFTPSSDASSSGRGGGWCSSRSMGMPLRVRSSKLVSNPKPRASFVGVTAIGPTP